MSPYGQQLWKKFIQENLSQPYDLWIDMNEPSVFEVLDLLMPESCLHFGRVMHRDVRNAYGFEM